MQNSKLRIFGLESWIRKSRKLNKNSPSKARGSTRRGRECVFNSKFWIYRLLRRDKSRDTSSNLEEEIKRKDKKKYYRAKPNRGR